MTLGLLTSYAVPAVTSRAIIMVKKIGVTLYDTVNSDLERWASQQGRPVANLAAFLIENGIEAAKERGELLPATPTKRKPSKGK